MSFIERDLITNLLAQSAITALCGNRIYPIVAPENAVHPYVVLERVGGEVGYDLGGESGHKSAVMAISSVAKRYADAKALAGKVALYLSGLSANWTNSAIMAVFLDGESDDYDVETEQYTTTIYTRIHFREI